MNPVSPFLQAFRATVALLLVLLSTAAWAATQEIADGPVSENYRLGPGDRISVNVFNHPDLSGDYTLDGSGRFPMLLIGQVEGAGKTAAELEVAIVDALRPDYLVNPRVTVQVLTYRPFYIIGEINSAGDYPYVDGMTYLNAIAIAGGYTFRAKQDIVYVIRAGDPEEEEIRLPVSDRVQPGDIIRVDERMF
ncbi:MAG: polysaccharide biosynthesis/export family protein [Xanthomonadales bacterium]|jgi:polysaccharide export outer membrane protein|nr:polysaccharide biosynthesis/export family protein [Xanthomonadales bacterium]